MTPEARRARALWLGTWRALRRWHRYSVEDLDHLLTPGPKLVVGYHGRPIAHDLCMLQTVLLDRTGHLPRAIVHDQLPGLPGLAALVEGAELLLGTEAEFDRAVREGSLVFVTPGGSREGCRSHRHRYEVNWGRRQGYVRLAARHGLPIVPVASLGADDTYVGLNDGEALGARLGLPKGVPVWLGVGPLGLWPFSPPFPVKVTTRIGAPIATAGVDPGDRDAVARVHATVVEAVQSLLANRPSPPPSPAPPARPAPRSRPSGVPMPASPLTETRIAALRAAYKPDDLIAGGLRSLASPWEAAQPWLRAQIGLFYALPGGGQPVMSPRDRERVVLALLAHGMGMPLNTATHIYWGLMEGLTLDDVHATFALASMYGGLDRYTDANRIYDVTSSVLAGLPDDTLDVGSVLTALAKALPV